MLWILKTFENNQRKLKKWYKTDENNTVEYTYHE